MHLLWHGCQFLAWNMVLFSLLLPRCATLPLYAVIKRRLTLTLTPHLLPLAPPCHAKISEYESPTQPPPLRPTNSGWWPLRVSHESCIITLVGWLVGWLGSHYQVPGTPSSPIPHCLLLDDILEYFYFCLLLLLPEPGFFPVLSSFVILSPCLCVCLSHHPMSSWLPSWPSTSSVVDSLIQQILCLILERITDMWWLECAGSSMQNLMTLDYCVLQPGGVLACGSWHEGSIILVMNII